MHNSVEVNFDGLILRGKLFLPEHNKKDVAVLFLHGWTGKANENAAQFLADNRYIAMTISLSGHNDSEGKIEDQSRQKSLQEVLAAYDYLRSQIGEGKKIVVAGNSYGAYLATLLCAVRPVTALQLRVPANYSDDGFDKPQVGRGGDNPAVMEWRQQQLSYDATKALRALHDFAGPVQIIEAELDERIPQRSTQNYIDAIQDKSRLEYHLMEGWPHSLGLDKQRNEIYQKLLLNWLNEQV